MVTYLDYTVIKTRKQMKIKKICLVIHSLQVGGMERVMTELAWYFVREKIWKYTLYYLEESLKSYIVFLVA